MYRQRAILVALFAVLSAMPLLARVAWLVGEGAPLDVPAVAKTLEAISGEQVNVVTNGMTYLSAWANDPKQEESRRKVLNAEMLLISPSERESGALATLALSSILAQRDPALRAPLLVASQKVVYGMSGLCDSARLQRIAKLAVGSGCGLVALPEVWRRVYTDDTFYNGKVPKGVEVERYVFASALTLALRGEEYPLPPFSGVHEELAQKLIQSIRSGYALWREVLAFAERTFSNDAFPVRYERAFKAVLFDGAFEHAIGDWLLRFAEADGRELTLLYTTDTTLKTGLPGLFRTSAPPRSAPNVSLYTRPAFADNSGLEELAHLSQIISADANKPEWVPFPFAVAAWPQRLTGKPVYDGARPTPSAAAMFASMLYLKWTGSAVLPKDVTQQETTAITIGLNVMLAHRLNRLGANAVLCRPLSDGRYAFSLLRRPQGSLTLYVEASDPTVCTVSPRSLTFTAKNFWAQQSVSLARRERDVFDKFSTAGDQPLLLLWKAPVSDLPGQNTGAREIQLPE